MPSQPRLTAQQKAQLHRLIGLAECLSLKPPIIVAAHKNGLTKELNELRFLCNQLKQTTRKTK